LLSEYAVLRRLIVCQNDAPNLSILNQHLTNQFIRSISDELQVNVSARVSIYLRVKSDRLLRKLGAIIV
jgi:hypothetical protein